MSDIDEITTPIDPRILADDERRAAWVIYQLKLRGLSLASLARQYKKDRTGPRIALRKRYPIWEVRIAQALGIEPQDLFPERYDDVGVPKMRPGRRTDLAQHR